MDSPIIDQVKERLDELEKIIREDECNLLPMFCLARKNFVKFMNDFSVTEKPLIGVTNDGRITGEWRDKIAKIICGDKGCKYKFC